MSVKNQEKAERNDILLYHWKNQWYHARCIRDSSQVMETKYLVNKSFDYRQYSSERWN